MLCDDVHGNDTVCMYDDVCIMSVIDDTVCMSVCVWCMMIRVIDHHHVTVDDVIHHYCCLTYL